VVRSGAVRLSSVLAPRDREFFDLFEEAGGNIERAAGLLENMLVTFPERNELARDILICEQDGDRITHDIIQRLNQTFVTPIDREDIYALASALDDVVDYTEEVSDYLGLYKIEAPMSQAQDLAHVLHAAARQISEAMTPGCRAYVVTPVPYTDPVMAPALVFTAEDIDRIREELRAFVAEEGAAAPVDVSVIEGGAPAASRRGALAWMRAISRSKPRSAAACSASSPCITACRRPRRSYSRRQVRLERSARCTSSRSAPSSVPFTYHGSSSSARRSDPEGASSVMGGPSGRWRRGRPGCGHARRWSARSHPPR